MSRIAILVLAAFVLVAIALSRAASDPTSPPTDNTAPGAPPVYRLDARFHKMPEEMVAQLLANPPSRSLLSRPRRCEVTSEGDTPGPGWERLGYCVCISPAACREGPIFEMGDDMWECTGPFGFVDSNGTAVCAARYKATKVTVGSRSAVPQPTG